MPVRWIRRDIQKHSPAVARFLAGALSGLKELADLNLQRHKFCLAGAISLVNALQSLSGLTHLKMGALEELPADLVALTGLQTIGLSTGLQTIGLSTCQSLEKLPAVLGALTRLQEIDLAGCESLKELPPELFALNDLHKINLSWCGSLEKLSAGIGGLTELREINLSWCVSLTELPAELGTLTQLKEIDLLGCDALHTPPPHIVCQGTGAVLEFLRDLAKGYAPCHLIKVVLLGNQRAGKSSLADSLVLGRPVTRADRDRTVGIEVRRWPVGRESQLVVNIYDAAGQRVYRATHGLFMSAGALFLHVVRSDMPEDEAVETLLEWVEVVQQEAPGAVMGVVWTHIDCASPTVSKSRVLGLVREEITEQMRALDDAMREMEDVIADHLQDRGAEEGGSLCEKWIRARKQRDAALKALDQWAMASCTAEDVVGGSMTKSQVRAYNESYVTRARSWNIARRTKIVRRTKIEMRRRKIVRRRIVRTRTVKVTEARSAKWPRRLPVSCLINMKWRCWRTSYQCRSLWGTVSH